MISGKYSCRTCNRPIYYSGFKDLESVEEFYKLHLCQDCEDLIEFLNSIWKQIIKNQ